MDAEVGNGRQEAYRNSREEVDVVKDINVVGVQGEDVDGMFRGSHVIGCCDASRHSQKQACEGDHLW